MFGLSLELTLILIICLVAAGAFEFINGFHDTANAVATVIYTKALNPTVAVIWSGICNFFGVFVGGIAVAMGIVNILPSAALVDENIYHSVAIIMALILTAIIWNLGTWYFGLPCSSSHTLLGSIFGVGLAYMLLPDAGAIALNWSKVKDAGLSLLISPLIGFGLTMGLMRLLKRYYGKESVLFDTAPKRKHPPTGIRSILILACTSVSFTHGSNDGQKGVGLVMMILIAIVPAKFALDNHKSPEMLYDRVVVIENIYKKIDTSKISDEKRFAYHLVLEKTADIKTKLAGVTSFDSLKGHDNFELRKDINLISKQTAGILTISVDEKIERILSKDDEKKLEKDIKYIKAYVEYAPVWVLLMISIALGMGTMIGWKRIVGTVGEKIGKTPLTYAQGACAQLVTASTIGLSTGFGLPVSTTHILSSGVAGSMVAENGLKNLRKKTVRSILTAWLITLPVTILMAGALFLLLRWIFV